MSVLSIKDLKDSPPLCARNSSIRGLPHAKILRRRPSRASNRQPTTSRSLIVHSARSASTCPTRPSLAIFPTIKLIERV